MFVSAFLMAVKKGPYARGTRRTHTAPRFSQEASRSPSSLPVTDAPRLPFRSQVASFGRRTRSTKCHRRVSVTRRCVTRPAKCLESKAQKQNREQTPETDPLTRARRKTSNSFRRCTRRSKEPQEPLGTHSAFSPTAIPLTDSLSLLSSDAASKTLPAGASTSSKPL